ncbi:hypothetical protein RKD19_003705 [Streptomyces canus]|uniref:hypothetical protein n=1 Tax=unclassified Streptomyces TaxID=2593676 RepID=UPI000F646C99|nr:hypothetical protein [Streptomyces sp. RP5T]RRR87423.1 hypothetical protein EHS43_01135 [Streptomyces sp. RP5T]
MSLTQQHLLDTHRARHLGTPVPPAPGTHDVRILRELREYRRFRAVLAGRPARGWLRHVLRHRAHRRVRPGC